MNLLFIVAEELRADCLSCYGNTFCPTPHLDALAERGMRCDGAFTVHGKCVPSRVAMLSGSYPASLGVRGISTYPEHPPPDAFLHLRQRGWQTALFGKNHVLKDPARSFACYPEPGPTFQRYRWLPGEERSPARCALLQGRLDQPFAATRDALSVDQFSSFLDGCGGRPFAAWLNCENAHPPYCACEPFYSAIDRAQVPPPCPPAFAGRPAVLRVLHRQWQVDRLTPAELLEIKAVYHAQVLAVDAVVGRALAELDRRGRLADTLVVFTSDHGDWAGEGGLVEKWDTCFDDALLRLPLIMAGPGIAPGTRLSGLVENIDILPSALELMGVDGFQVPHGRSWAARFARGGSCREAVFAEGGVEPEALGKIAPLGLDGPYAGKQLTLQACPESLAAARMLRTERWKLVRRVQGGAPLGPPVANRQAVQASWSCDELYDLAADPHETCNRLTDPALAGTLADLDRQLFARVLAAAPRTPALPAHGVEA